MEKKNAGGGHQRDAALAVLHIRHESRGQRGSPIEN
jgi:hypothetical protein